MTLARLWRWLTRPAFRCVTRRCPGCYARWVADAATCATCGAPAPTGQDAWETEQLRTAQPTTRPPAKEDMP